MIVKGIIKTINFSENSCTVRLPLFETAAAEGEVILDAIISIQPGLYNGYVEGDVVFVDFENNKLSQPIVVGKLYLGAEKEAANGAPSAMTVSNLKVTTQATLPVDTRLSLEGLGKTVPVEKGISSYHSLVDIIKALHQTETSVQQTIKDQSGAVANIIVEYLSQPVDQEPPTAESGGWSISSPDYRDGFAIWQKTTCYNHRGQALSTEIICLSSIASAVLYKVRCSTRVHAGTNQTEAIKISAWVKLGTELETLDTSANICYCWSDGKGSALTNWTESNAYEVTLEPAQLKAQNLVIQVRHSAEVYEEETIMYAPLNTPVLCLSNEADVLLYAANGTDCLSATGVSSTATLYVNGDPLEATYVWEWDSKLCTCEHAVGEGGQQLPNTIIVTAVNSTSAPGVVTCKATVTLDGPFKGKVYSKDFTVTQTKVGTSIVSQDTYYALIHNKHSAGDIKTPPKTGDLIVRDQSGNQLNTRNESHLEEWSLTPPEHTPNTNGWKYWTTVKTTYSTSLDDFEFSTPIINEDLSGVYSLAQGKTTNYYGTFEPTRNPEPTATQVYKPNLRIDDCWFDTNYKEISATELATLDFASKYINYYVGEGDTKTLVTSSNYSTLGIAPKTTKAYTKGALKQCTAIAADGTATWEDIGDELVTNKLTATYINALDITAKKIKILNDAGNTTLFEADGLSNTHTVKIAGFDVSANGLFTSKDGTAFVTAFSPAGTAGAVAEGVYVGKDGIKLGQNFSVDQSGNVIASSLKISSEQTIGEALSATQAAAEATAQANLENAFKDPTTAGETTLGSNWLSTTNVVAQNLTAGKIEVKSGTSTVLYADANAPDNTQIGGFTVSSNKIANGNNLILSTADLPSNLTVAGRAAKDWRLVVGSKFGVDSSGNTYANGGTIGGFTLDSSSLTAGTVGSSGGLKVSTADYKATIAGSERTNLRFSVGSNFGVSSAGAVYASSGTIGGFTLDSSSISAGTAGSSGGVKLATSNYSATIGGTSRSSLRFSVGSNFGVSSGGTLYTKSGVIDSATIDSATINSATINDGVFNTVISNGALISNGTGGCWYRKYGYYVDKSTGNVGYGYIYCEPILALPPKYAMADSGGMCPNCFWSGIARLGSGWNELVSYLPGFLIGRIVSVTVTDYPYYQADGDGSGDSSIDTKGSPRLWQTWWDNNTWSVQIYNSGSKAAAATIVVGAYIY